MNTTPLPPTWVMAIEAEKLTHDLRVRELRGIASGLREKGPNHPFWALAELLGNVAEELVAAERFARKKVEHGAKRLLIECARLPDRDGKPGPNRWRVWTGEADAAFDELNEALHGARRG